MSNLVDEGENQVYALTEIDVDATLDRRRRDFDSALPNQCFNVGFRSVSTGNVLSNLGNIRLKIKANINKTFIGNKFYPML